MPSQGRPYLSTARKLMLAIDVGTTFSGVSFCVLDPGKVPEIQSVIRYPGQEAENRARDTKIPSVLFYDEDGQVRAAGAEAVSDGVEMEALDEGWTRAEWFKLRLRPDGMQAKGERLPKIWIDKSVVQIFANYLAYIFKCAKAYISDTHSVGRHILESGSGVEFVLSHPNGWGGRQQSKMRRAAISAGLVPDTAAGAARIHFVTEGEASLHFCIASGLAGENVQEGKHIMIVDAGGGTVDLSAYKVIKTSPLDVVESSTADCLMAGSVFVNFRARLFLEYKLKDTRFVDDGFIDSMLQSFESTAKPTFRDATKTSYIKFGGPRDTDDKCGIKRGVLSLSGSEMSQFFLPSIDAIKKAIQGQLLLSGSIARDTVILLVGGFAGNPYLRSQLNEYADQKGVALFFPEHQTAKAEGALCYHLDHYVSARCAKYVYGTECHNAYDGSMPDHQARLHKVVTHADGRLYVPGAFSRIIPKGTLVTEEQEFRANFICAEQNPRWTDKEMGKFSTLCRVHAHLPPKVSLKQKGAQGSYFMATCDVVLLFGLTELKAQLSWKENGQERRAPAVVVYEDDVDSLGD